MINQTDQTVKSVFGCSIFMHDVYSKLFFASINYRVRTYECWHIPATVLILDIARFIPYV
jgi:hypothetical protein